MYDPDDYTPLTWVEKFIDALERGLPVLAIIVVTYVLAHFVIKYW